MVLHCATVKILQINFYWSCNSKSSVLWRTWRKWERFSFEIRHFSCYFSVFAVFILLCMPGGRSCYMLNHFEITYLEKSVPDNWALPQIYVPSCFNMLYKEIAEKPVVLSEPTMLSISFLGSNTALVHCRSTLVPLHSGDLVQRDT